MIERYGNMVRFNLETFGGWDECIRLGNDHLSLVCTTEVGPRILHLSLDGRPNMLKVFGDQAGLKGGRQWNPFGGHRLWVAPEKHPRTYHPDNGPVEYHWDGESLFLTSPTEEGNLIRKEMEIRIAKDAPTLSITHRIVNAGAWEISAAPWVLTVFAPGTTAVLPQESFAPHPDALLPVRPMVLWAYTNLADPRLSLGRRFVRLRQDPAIADPQKIGVFNSHGWGAAALDGQVFVKQTDVIPGAVYPDMGCNFEVFTNGDMIELESLAPLAPIPPDGGYVEHVERWTLFEGRLPDDEDGVAALFSSFPQ